MMNETKKNLCTLKSIFLQTEKIVTNINQKQMI